ncbi:MAG: glutamate-1-semialdehyde 2,1-aminomutase [Candidatus Methylacidiphilales bacterium]
MSLDHTGTGAVSHQLFERAKLVIPGGVNSPVRAFRAVGGEPFFARKAEGCRIYDADGRAYVDYVCTWGPSILGHADPEVVGAVVERARLGTSFGVPNPLEVDLAEAICAWVPGVEQVRMCNSGTEATMSCLRLARGFTGRDRIIKFEGCYHGHSDALLVKAGSGALTLGQPDSAGVPAALAELTITLPFNDLDAVQEIMERLGEEVAGMIVEPIPANAGLILPEPGFLEGLRELTARYGTVLIFDEVMTGFRLGKAGAQGLLGVQPDLSAFGKVIGGGLPVGAFGGRREIMRCLAPMGPVYQAGTLSGNPLAMAAGLAQLRALENRDAFSRLESLGARLESGVQSILKRRGLPYQWRRVGSMFCLFFSDQPVRNLAEAKQSDTGRFARFFHNLLQRGIYFPPSQFETCFLSLAHDEEGIDRTLEAVDEALATL